MTVATAPEQKLLGWRWNLLVAVVYLIGLASLGIALRHNLGFPLDDSWIHQEIARNLIQYHSFGFNPGVTSSGTSSTLWTLILSIDYILFPTHSPVFFPLILNAVLVILSGMMLWRMAVRDGLPLFYALALALLPALSGNYVWLVFIGMEHVLFVALSLLAILLWFRAKGEVPDTRSAILTGLTLGALGMTRPEGLALSFVLFALYRWCGRSFTDVLHAGAVAVVFLVPSFLINLKTSGSLLPTTLRGRRFLFSGTDKLHIGRSTVRGLTIETYHKVIQHNFFHSTAGWVIVGVILAFYGCFVLLRRFPNRTAILILWAIVHYASYCFTLPATGHGGRYQPFVLVLFPPLLAIAIYDFIAIALHLLKQNSRVLRVSMQCAVLVAIAALTAVTLPRWSVALRDSIFNINNCHLKMAEYLDQHFPPGTKIGVFDIGTIGYFSHVDVVDLGGLVDRNYLPYLIGGHVPEYLDQQHIDYVIIPHNGNETRFGDQLHLLHNPALRLDEVHTDAIDYNKWKSSYDYTQHAYWQQTLYHIVRLNPNPAAADPIAH